MKQAFEGSRKSVFLLDPNEVVIIGLDTPDGSEHPLYDERVKWPLDEATVKTMQRRGIKKPILVEKIMINGEEKPVVIDGRRRVMHAREANRRLDEAGSDALIKVPVLPPERGDNAKMMELMIFLNEHVETDSIMNRARKALRYVDMGHTEEEAAEIFKVQGQTIRNWLTLLELCPDVQEAVESGKIAASAAMEFVGLTPEDQQKTLNKLLASGKKVTAKETRAEANKKRKKSDKKAIVPGKTLLKLILQRGTGSNRVSEDFLLGLKFAMGTATAKEVPGLEDLLENE